MKNNHENSVHYLVLMLSKRLETACHSVQEARQEVWWLLEKITGKKKTQLIALESIKLSEQQQIELDSWINQRVIEKKPLQYILGTVPFCDLEIMVEPPILIPRPETEEWVTWLINELEPVKNQPIKILDLCTGSGCIALALGKAFAHATVVGIDINPQALELAEKNKQHNGISNVTFGCSNLDQALDQSDTFDLIVSNPPYLTTQEYDQLEPEVKRWEDPYALVAPDDGLEFYLRIAHLAPARLSASSVFAAGHLPRVVVEIGTHVQPVKAAFQQCGMDDCSVHHDMQGVARWICSYLT